jgi:hypothetical protein
MLSQNVTSTFGAPFSSDTHSPQYNGSSTSFVNVQGNQSAKDISVELPEFCGPSSSEYTLNVVSGNLKAKGIPEAILGKTDPPSTTSFGSSSLGRHGSLSKMITLDPLWNFARDSAVHLVHDWCNGVGLLYPVVSRSDMLRTTNKVFDILERAQREGLSSKEVVVAEALFHDETHQLKMVLAIGGTLANGGRTEQAQKLFQSITEVTEGLFLGPPDIRGIQLLTLVVCRAASSSRET